MDAKKKAKLVKPRFFNDTKAYRASTYFGFGILAYSFFFGFLAYQYHRSHPDRLITNNPITRFLNSEEMRLRHARLLGLAPPDRKLGSKYSGSPDNIERSME